MESEEWCMIYTRHFGVYSKLKKTKLIRIKESLCIFDSITANLPGRPGPLDPKARTTKGTRYSQY